MDKHTPESDWYTHHIAPLITTREDGLIAGFHEPGAIANRNRAVACVKALADIPDPAAFVKSHAELVEAVESAVDALSLIQSTCFYEKGAGGDARNLATYRLPVLRDALANANKVNQTTGESK